MKSDLELASPPNTATVTGIYLNNYEQIVKPQQRFLIPNYFINYWVRRLGLNLAWLVISLKQACWRANDDTCIISQKTLSQETGLSERTIRTELNQNPMRHWYIPTIQYQKGVVVGKTYQPWPNKYMVYLSTPLISEHLSGLYEHIRIALNQELSNTTSPPQNTPEIIESAIETLLQLKSKDALAHLENLNSNNQNPKVFTHPMALTTLVEELLEAKLTDLSPQAPHLSDKLNRLHTHLTEIGYTNCRQYFRQQWVPKLGVAMAWLIMGLRSRCYYNPDNGEFRDTYTWAKKDLAALLGQSNQNLRRLLKHLYADHFLQVLNNQKHKITIRVALAQEPLTTEEATSFWNKQPGLLATNATNLPITPPTNATNLPITPPPNATNLPITPHQTQQICRSPATNATNLPPLKYFKESILLTNKGHEKQIQNNSLDLNFLWQQVLDQLQGQMAKSTFNTWVASTKVIKWDSATLVIGVKNEQAKDWLENRLKPIIERAVNLVTEQSPVIEFQVKL